MNLDYLKKWKLENREKQRGYDRAYYARNRRKILRRQRKWQAKNPDKMREYQKTYRNSHLGQSSRIAEYQKNYYLKNRKRILARRRKIGEV